MRFVRLYADVRPAAILLAGCFALVSLGCGDADEQEDELTYERPEEAQEIISDEMLAQFEEMGLSIHGGLNPPDVSGTYVFDSGRWIDAPRPENVGLRICDSEATWTVEQDGTLSTEKVYTSGCTGEGSSSGLYLSGEDNCFTTYNRSQETFEGCERTTLSVSSACLTSDGFTNYRSAFVDIAHGEENCEALVNDGRLPPIDGIVLTEETDGLVSRVD